MEQLKQHKTTLNHLKQKLLMRDWGNGNEERSIKQ